MTTTRDHIAALEETGDLTRIDQRVHWADRAPAVAATAASENGPAILFENSGETRLVSGVYGGPDQMQPRERAPWSRLSMALSSNDASYEQLLSSLSRAMTTNSTPSRAPLAAEYRDIDLHSLGLPAVGTDTTPAVTLGLLAVSLGDENETTWAPLQGSVHGSDELRSSVPASLAESLSQDTDVTVALGVPAACLVAGALEWTGNGPVADPIPTAGAIDTFSLADAQGGLVPSSAEAVFDGVVSAVGGNTSEMAASWEKTTPTANVEIRITDVALRENPVIPFTPLGASLADDLHLTGLIESSRLFHRVNNYWGVAPVEWVALPVETKLGMCLVASDILYAGFEWQLANTLFSFSRLFDTILILDADTSAENLQRAFDDMWVKAHPSHDWQFSEPAAPPATTTAYRSNGTTARLYIDATWDPRWDEEYIAPRVNFETSFPTDVRSFVFDNWNDMGFDTDLQEE